MQIIPWLTFNGDCREAMNFYRECLGGELFFQTVSNSPMADEMPEQMKNVILHATLTKGKFVVMASDIVEETGLLKGNSVSLLLNCSSEQEIRTCYEKLSKGGTQTQPEELNFYGAFYGNLTDKFGNNWLLHYQL